MSSKTNLLVVSALCLLFIPLLAFGTQKPTAKKHHKVADMKPDAQAAPIVPSGPLPALPLDQIPSTAPLVDYKNGQLSIVSRNATLGDILRSIHTQTGAVIEMPSNSTERVVGYFGPGPARDVLASLLNGSHFNYVLLGSAANANALERVILITKSGPDDVAPTTQADASGDPSLPQPNRMGRQGMIQQVPQDADAAADATDDSQDEVDDSASAADDAAAQQQQQQPPNPPNGIRSPEQLLQELQRQQMIQQQQQQQQNNGAQQQITPFQQAPEQ